FLETVCSLPAHRINPPLRPPRHATFSPRDAIPRADEPCRGAWLCRRNLELRPQPRRAPRREALELVLGYQQHPGGAEPARRPFVSSRKCCAHPRQLSEMRGTASNRSTSSRSRV